MRCRARFSDVRAAADEQTGRLRPGHARSSERPVRGRYGKAPHKGSTAAWPSGLGRGLQSPVRRFDSARRLQGFPGQAEECLTCSPMSVVDGAGTFIASGRVGPH